MKRLGCRVCATVIVYDPDPTHVGIAQLFDSTEAAGTTDYSIGVDQKSAPGTADWIRGRLPHAVVFEFEWHDDFAEARNLTLDRMPTGCDWWYWIDSDDLFEMSAGSSIPNVLRSVPAYVGVVRAPYVIGVRGPDGAFARIDREMFIRTSLEARWADAVHECVSYPHGTIECCSRDLGRRHLRGEPGRTVPSRGRNGRILERMIEREPNRLRLWECLAIEYEADGRLADAARAYAHILTLPGVSDDDAAVAAVVGTPVACRAGDLDTAGAMVDAAIRLRPWWPETFYARAQLLYCMGDWRSSSNSISAGLAAVTKAGSGVLRASGVLSAMWQLDGYVYQGRPHVLLVLCHEQLGDVPSVLDHIDAALAFPSTPAWVRDLLVEIRSNAGASPLGLAAPPFTALMRTTSGRESMSIRVESVARVSRGVPGNSLAEIAQRRVPRLGTNHKYLDSVLTATGIISRQCLQRFRAHRLLATPERAALRTAQSSARRGART